MKNTSLLSVIVPVYNVQDYLSRCIESILTQTYTNFELILIDDGSKDSSLEICNNYKFKDDRIVVLKQSNAGSSVARNTGLSYAKGEYIGYVDSDDWILPNMFEKMIDASTTYNLQVVECGLYKSNEVIPSNQTETNVKIENQEQALKRIIKADSFAVWRRIYHASVIKGMNFIPGKIHQDVFYTLDVLNKSNKIGVINKNYYIYNVENESIIRSAYNLKKLDAIDAVYYVKKICSNYGLELQKIGDVYVMKGLINHYISLFHHSHLDLNFQHRKKLKFEIKQHYQFIKKVKSIERTRSLIVIKSTFGLYKWLLIANKKRIMFKLKLIKLFNV
ncbi:glycosyltransferase [Maribacter litoralis]|uniref:Glycosyltransferase involved in cell wall bisynthesis n=1 Tax=Maribacter litoralis TaxID=2059726 RepID=A0A653VBY4_9FLAO|nr:glycosyltransferase [Maribacter litoralis]VXC03672.1 Glycosyltransferase involved in cell wall bisynthesis [Maribacter litoralis]